MTDYVLSSKEKALGCQKAAIQFNLKIRGLVNQGGNPWSENLSDMGFRCDKISHPNVIFYHMAM
jgi:hypothetical protein